MARGVDSVVDSRIFVQTTVESCHNIVCFGSAASGWHFFYIFFLEKCCTLKVLCIFVKQTNKQHAVMTTTETIKALLEGRTTEQLIEDAKEARKNKAEESNRMICALAMDVLSERIGADEFEALYNELYKQE